MDLKNLFTIPEFILGSILIYFIQFNGTFHPTLVSGYIDIGIAILITGEIIYQFVTTPFKSFVLRKYKYDLTFALFFILFFLINRFFIINNGSFRFILIPPAIILIRNFFIWTGIFKRLNKISNFFEGISLHPAQTILLSFLLVILTGTILLMMPFTTTSKNGLSILNALFTSTSAVCVTGLIVVNTATAFTFWGKLIIMFLIETGGLSIMILSYFTIFALRKKVTLEEKVMLSYMLNEQDMSRIGKSIKTIIYTSFIIEGTGMLLLYIPFRKVPHSPDNALFLSLFHSISAFCNAGFSLFSDSLEQFKGNVFVNFVIAILIILGGISFAVLSNLKDSGKWHLRKLIKKENPGFVKLQVNSKVVLLFTAFLLLSSTLILYGIEHTKSLSEYSLGKQYLIAFFQSVTLRTAGFNTISIGNLATTTLIVMTVFMFIGAAAGSTAGGIKINNVAVILAYIKSFLTGSGTVVLFKHSIPREKVLKSMLILLFGISSVVLGIILLSYTEHAALKDITFETVSAFGTVGLSTGLTSHLSGPGKIIISSLMFMGRLGPLTILAAATRHHHKTNIEFPVGNISIG